MKPEGLPSIPSFMFLYNSFVFKAYRCSKRGSHIAQFYPLYHNHPLQFNIKIIIFAHLSIRKKIPNYYNIKKGYTKRGLLAYPTAIYNFTLNLNGEKFGVKGSKLQNEPTL